MVDLLVQSQLNDRLPALLAQDLKIARKTAELTGIRNVCRHRLSRPTSLPNHPHQPDVEYEDDAVATSAQISKDVYDYYSK